MTLRLRILTLIVVVAATITAMTALVVVTLTSTGRALDRVMLAHKQYEAAVAMAEVANRYSEQIAERLLIGPEEQRDYEEARQSVLQSFQLFAAATEAGLADRSDHPEIDRDTARARVTAMQSAFIDVDRAAQRAIRRMERGDSAGAVDLYQQEIENRLDATLERLIGEAIDTERMRVARVEAAVETYRTRLFVAVALVALLTLGAGILLGAGLARALVTPVTALMRGTAAVAAGDLDHRITVIAKDELGTLAARFNEMAERLQSRRDAVLGSKRELEIQVADRTRELAEANSRLLLLDRQRIDLLADVSHELRTPLSALRGEAEISLRGASKPEAVYRETLERIVSQASDMARLVEDLLFLARSEAEELRFEQQSVAIDAVVAETVKDAGILGHTRGVKLISVCKKKNLVVQGDLRRLRQALTILLDNAIQYSRPDAQVDVECRIFEGAVEIIVRDSGIGIPAEDTPFIFDRFHRSWNARRLNPGGNGLGLSIAKWITERHGGQISIDSGAGGTVARVRLPLAAANDGGFGGEDPADRG